MFLPNVPGARFIPGVMSIPESRVCMDVSLQFIFSASNFEEVQIEQGCESLSEAAESSCFAESEPNNGKTLARCFKAKVNMDEDTFREIQNLKYLLYLVNLRSDHIKLASTFFICMYICFTELQKNG